MGISSYAELKDFLIYEKKLYLGNRNFFSIIKLKYTNENLYYIWKYVSLLRKCEYYKNKGNLFFLAIYRRKKNKLGWQLGIDIHENCFDKGLRIFHGNIVVNNNAKIGKNCCLHGNNCIGNNGIVDLAPSIGDNVDIGYGAVVIGGICLTNDIIIGANAVVNKSFRNSKVIVGVPANKVR